MDLGRLQSDVADELGVFVGTVGSWERGTTTPPSRYLPGIVSFLGYDPRQGD